MSINTQRHRSFLHIQSCRRQYCPKEQHKLHRESFKSLVLDRCSIDFCFYGLSIILF